MSFLTEVCQSHHHMVVAEVQRCLLFKVVSAVPPSTAPPGGRRMVQVEGFWLELGSESPAVPEGYVITPNVKRNLRNLARVVSAQ